MKNNKKISIYEARRTALFEHANSMTAKELMSAFFYIANKADIRRMADVLQVESKAKKIQNES